LPFARSAIDVAGVAKLRNMVGFPLVAKSRKGFGSNGVRMLLSDEHVDLAHATGDTIVQEAIDWSVRQMMDYSPKDSSSTTCQKVCIMGDRRSSENKVKIIMLRHRLFEKRAFSSL